MTTLNIEGQKVNVDDGFLKLSPEDQAKTVDEIADHLGIKPSAQGDIPPVHLAADPHLTDDQLQQDVAAGRQEAYDELPWYKQALQAGQDVSRLMTNGASLGFADKLAAVSDPTNQPTVIDTARAVMNKVNPISAVADVVANSIVGNPTYDKHLQEQRDATQAAKDRARSAAIPAEIVGGVLTGSTLMNNGLTLAGRVATPGMRGVLTRAALSAPEGATYGTVDALGHDTDVKKGAITGAVAGPIGSLAGDVVSTVAGRVLPAVIPSRVPNLDQLRQQARNAYDAADNAGVIVTPQAMQRLNQSVEGDLANFGYDPALQPRIAAVINRLQNATQDNVTLRGIDIIRRVANNARTSQDASERAAGNIVINNIDDFVGNLHPNDILAGNMRQGVTALNQARTLWTRVAKNETLMNAVEAARLRAGSTGSGGNVENATRQNLRKFIDPASTQQMRNLTQDERDAVNEIVLGTPGQNFMRLAGKLSPSGNGLMAGLGIVGTMANPHIGLMSLGGMAAKTVADRSVMNAVNALDELVRAGGTQQARQQAQAVLRSLTQAQRNTVSQIVLQGALNLNRGAQEPAHQ
jgi:hypothetical protein